MRTDDLKVILPLGENAQGEAKETVTGEKTTQGESELSVEDAFERLELLTQELEKQDLSLEASFAFYEEGMKLVRFCSDALDRVEKKVLVLSQDGEVDEF